MRNTRYPEGSIAEQYLVHESVTYCKSYLRRMDNEDIDTSISGWNVSCVSLLVRPDIIETRRQFRLTESETAEAHWQVLVETDEVKPYLEEHLRRFEAKNGEDFDELRRRRSFLRWFLTWVHMPINSCKVL